MWRGSDIIAHFIGTLIGLGIIAVFVIMIIAGILAMVMAVAAVIMSIIAGLSKNPQKSS